MKQLKPGKLYRTTLRIYILGEDFPRGSEFVFLNIQKTNDYYTTKILRKSKILEIHHNLPTFICENTIEL